MNRNIFYALFTGLACQLLPTAVEAQNPRPNDPLPMEDVRKWTGDWEGTRPSRDIRILWLSGPEDHGGGEHDYIRIQDLFVPMLQDIPRVTVDTAFEFPSREQFDQADLVIQYLHLPDLTDSQFEVYQAYVDQGGAVFSIHESCIMRPIDRAEKLANVIGCSWKGNSASEWSKFGHERALYLKTESPVFADLPRAVRLNDESYWNLLARDNVEVIAAIAPASEVDATSFESVLKADGVRSDAFWTYFSGSGRVIGTTTGHYTYTFHDPLYRLLLARCVAWALDEDPAPFMSIVTHGISNPDGFVGTKDSMMDYQNRKH